MIGYARLVSPSNTPNHSTILDPKSVISLGHTSEQPLICLGSELSYRFEPHGLFCSAGLHAWSMSVPAGVAGVYPGWCRLGGYQGGTIPGTKPRPD